ncbi:hypothetical protein BCR44DRAFT_1144036 [Catenaria anguillulae PL171]|uniref:Protein kinase domain-containing protein n=1 Tax=Catenaria anguillulae PL171 TaxID=765915 RepID=A0A1Y2HJQ1_9FUNG|nr:hypothetical protein BCR44DRAFT_1144036 [Catenaria anguillulae PL171]
MSPAINPPFATRGQLGSRQPPQAPSPPSPPAESRATTPPSNGSAAIPAPGIMAGGPAGFVASAIAKSSAANSSPSHRHSFGAFAPATDPVLAYKPLPPRPLSTVGEYGPGHPSATASAAVPLSVPPAAGQPISIPPDVLLHASNTAAAASTTPPHGPEVSTTTTAQVVENYHGGQHYHHHHHHHHHHFHPSPSSTSLNAAFQTVSPPEDNSPRASFDVPRHAALQVTIPSRAANASSDSFGGHGIVSGGIPLTANSPFPLTSAPIPPTTMYPSGSGGGNSRNSSMDFIVQAQAPIAIPSTDTAVPSSLTNTPSSQMITSTASTVTVVNLSPMSPVTLEPASCSTSNSGSPASSSESLPGHGGQHSHHPAPSTRSPSLSTVSLHSVGTSSPLARGSVDYHQPLSAGPVQPAPHFRRSSSTNPRTSLANLASSASNTQPSSASVPLGSASSPSLANATVGSSSRASAAPSNVTASPSSAAAAAQAAAAAAASYVLTRVDNVGNVTDQYIVGNCIGRGSFGAVFRAIHMESHHTVAIKRFALADRKQMESILKEVRKMESLDHPNVVKYLGYVQTDKDFNIILEYVENGSLASTLKHFGPLPERVVGSIVCKVLQGLVYLHDRGLKHLDLKAANILTTKDGCVKLSDFGVSQSSVDTSSDKFVGSAYWMAPEVITLEGTHTASDIWSLGCTIIELLTGLPPYFDLLAMSALYKIVEDGCPPFPEGISPQLKDFLSSCFRKDCKERATARALLEHVWMIPFVHMVGAVNGLAIVAAAHDNPIQAPGAAAAALVCYEPGVVLDTNHGCQRAITHHAVSFAGRAVVSSRTVSRRPNPSRKDASATARIAGCETVVHAHFRPSIHALQICPKLPCKRQSAASQGVLPARDPDAHVRNAPATTCIPFTYPAASTHNDPVAACRIR